MSDAQVHDCIIIGAGLSGLVTAVRLREAGVEALILEARERVGGRILTLSSAEFNAADLDLGPAWWWSHQPNIQRLMRELDIQGFEQFEEGIGVYDDTANSRIQYFRNPPSPKSYRFVGGVGAVIDRLAAKLTPQQIELGQIAKSVTLDGNVVVVATEQGSYRAKHVVCTLPPKLVPQSIRFSPPLPDELVSVMGKTMTWMGQAMKVGLRYETAFWREKGLSGLTVSHTGPVAQFYDHSSADGVRAALFGWVGDHSPARALTPDQRKDAIIAQAVRLFGDEAANPLEYAECNWAQELFTTHPSSPMLSATEHPSYGHPLFQTPQFGGRLHWATTEASPTNGGYLDGAIVCGEQVASRIHEALP